MVPRLVVGLSGPWRACGRWSTGRDRMRSLGMTVRGAATGRSARSPAAQGGASHTRRNGHADDGETTATCARWVARPRAIWCARELAATHRPFELPRQGAGVSRPGRPVSLRRRSSRRTGPPCPPRASSEVAEARRSAVRRPGTASLRRSDIAPSPHRFPAPPVNVGAPPAGRV